MAQLRDLIVNGASRFIGNIFGDKAQLTTLEAPTNAGGTTYGPGTNGQVLKSNGTSSYWGNSNASDISYDSTNSGLLSLNTQEAIDELAFDLVEKMPKAPDFKITNTSAWTNFLNITMIQTNSIKEFSLYISNGQNIAVISVGICRASGSQIYVQARDILASSSYTAKDFCYKIDSSTYTISFYIRLKASDSSIIIKTLYIYGTGTFSFQTTGMSEPPSGVSYFKPVQDGDGNYIPDIYYRMIPDHRITTDSSSGGWYRFLTVSPATTSYTNMALLVQSSSFSSPCIISFTISGRHGQGTQMIMGGNSGEDFIYSIVGGQDYSYSAFYMYIPNNTKVQFWQLYDYEEAYFPQYNKLSNWTAELQSAQPSGYKLTPITSFTKNGTIAFSLSWNGSGPYTQTVTVSGARITAKSSITLQPTATQLSQLIADGVTAITIENNAGTLTAYALGAIPSTAMTIQCTVSEVIS